MQLLTTLLGSNNSGVTEPSLFGIDVKRPPHESNFPKKFAPNAQFIWDALLISDAYKKRLVMLSRNDLWSWSIREYLKTASRRGVFPFASSGPQTATDAVYNCLWVGRRNMIRYVDGIGLFKKVTLFRTSRQYKFTNTSTEVTTLAELNPIRDPSFVQWLTGLTPDPMFVMRDARIYHRLVYNSIDSKGTFDFNLLNMMRPVLKMTILCNTPLEMPRMGRVPTLLEMERYCQEIIWLPLIRTFRFKDTNTRLF